MSTPETGKRENYIKYAIIALVVILVILGIFFVREYREARKEQILGDIHRGVPLTADEVMIIRPWMTFDYINRIFRLPPDYLKNDLSITDSHYPGTSLSSYADYSHTNIVVLTDQIESAVHDYLTNVTSTGDKN